MKRFCIAGPILAGTLFALVACQPAPPPAVPPTVAPPEVVPPTVVSPTVEASQLPEPRVIAQWKVNMPEGPAFGFGSVWVPSHRSPNVTTRIDPISNTVSAVVQGTGYRAHQALVTSDAVWVPGESSDMTWIDPKTNAITTTAPKVKGGHTYAAYGFDSIWATTRDDRLDRIDPATSQIIASITLGDGFVDCNNYVLTTAAAVWVDHCDEQELIRIDPANNAISSKTPYEQLIAQAQAQTTVPAGKGTDFIWRSLPSGLLRIDPGTGAGLTFLPLKPEQLGAGFRDVATTDDAVWLSGFGRIMRVNVATNQIDTAYRVQPGETRVGTGFGSVWVAYEGSGLVQRLDIAP